MKVTDELINVITELIKKFLKNYVPTRYLNQKQACSYAGVSAGTINDWVKYKGLRIVILEENSNPKYDTRDIDAFMEKHKTRGRR